MVSLYKKNHRDWSSLNPLRCFPLPSKESSQVKRGQERETNSGDSAIAVVAHVMHRGRLS